MLLRFIEEIQFVMTDFFSLSAVDTLLSMKAKHGVTKLTINARIHLFNFYQGSLGELGLLVLLQITFAKYHSQTIL